MTHIGRNSHSSKTKILSKKISPSTGKENAHSSKTKILSKKILTHWEENARLSAKQAYKYFQLRRINEKQCKIEKESK